MNQPQIKFINHASVLISYNGIHLISDPWYEGNTFNNGWALLYENKTNYISEIFEEKVTHIWISHEHPDHFSINFFKKYQEIILKNKIKILFQETRDKRVITFLLKNNFLVQELKFKEEYILSDNFSIKCFKDGFYDSALLINCGGKKILNLNDCQVNEVKKALKIKKYTGKVDLLLSQFSYAAWKGGINNYQWRQKAALEKIDSIKIQLKCFEPKHFIPFASFIYFCNSENFYMNDSINTPNDIFEALKDLNISTLIMKPNDKFIFGFKNHNNNSAKSFWDEQIRKKTIVKERNINKFTLHDLKRSFQLYRKRIVSNNNMFLVKLIYNLSPFKFFKPVYIFLIDLGETVEIDYVRNKFLPTTKPPMLKMQAQSLDFIFKNQFGFDTLNVNARFEEESTSGWSKAARTLTIETLNNMGFKVNFAILFNAQIIKLFIKTMFKVIKNS